MRAAVPHHASDLVEGSGFEFGFRGGVRDSGDGFQVSGSGFRDQGSARDAGIGYRVPGIVFEV